jgi:hypothetical protein
LAHLVKARRMRTGVPKVTRTRYPPSRSAKPSARRALSGARGGKGDSSPILVAGSIGRGVALWESPADPRRRGEPASRAGLRAYLARSCAPCCPSLRRKRGQRRRAPRLIPRRAGGRGQDGAPGHRRCTGEPAAAAGRAREGSGGSGGCGRRRRSHRPGPAGPAPASTAANRAGAGPPPPRLLKVCTGRRERLGGASRPSLSRARARKARGAAGCFGCQVRGVLALSLIHSNTREKPTVYQGLSTAQGHWGQP